MTDYVPWLREIAAKGGKGGLNVDARALGRVADALESCRAERLRMLEALRTIIYASDKCQGHRNCDHDMTGWVLARAILAEVEG
jgi:hypothetical protein